MWRPNSQEWSLTPHERVLFKDRQATTSPRFKRRPHHDGRLMMDELLA